MFSRPRARTWPVVVFIVAVVAVLTSAASGPKTSGPQVVRGSIGPGALYELAIPANGNGDLVLYAHGYSACERPNLPYGDVGPLRDGLLALGYGVAYSSYSGWISRSGWSTASSRCRDAPGHVSTGPDVNSSRVGGVRTP
jgi:hypothetical protein